MKITSRCCTGSRHGWSCTGRRPRSSTCRFLLPLNRVNRAAAGVAAGELVEVVIGRDDEPRVVEVPEDLAAALAEDDTAHEAFAGLSYSHQREYVEWMTEAKRPETRARRVVQAMERLREGRTGR